jgi:tetratricopeptide (TPR) repeat protein
VKTVNAHFDEIDWLDYGEGLLGAREVAEMERHLAQCRSCRARSQSLRRLAVALSPMRELVEGEGPEARFDDRASVSRDSALAQETIRRVQSARDVIRAFGPRIPEPAAVPGLSPSHVLASVVAARENYWADLAQSRVLVAWSQEALKILSASADTPERELRGLEAMIRSSAAYLRLRDGSPFQALEELGAASEFLESAPPPRDLELAFWSYVRACCLRDLSRFGEALLEIERAEEIYLQFGEELRRARSRLLHAIILSDSGVSEKALPIYEELMADPAAVGDAPLNALLHLSLAYELVLTGEIARAKTIYARAANLLKKSGQESLLFRIRVGLSDIAQAEGRIEEALDLNLQLRPVFRERRLPWDEVRRELWIVRQLLELGRFEEAREACVALARRAGELSLTEETLRALTYLASAEHELNLEEVGRVQDDLRRIALGTSTHGSVA